METVLLDCLTHVDSTVEVDVVGAEKAFAQAELHSKLGFEVSVPRSFDGVTYTFFVSR